MKCEDDCPGKAVQPAMTQAAMHNNVEDAGERHSTTLHGVPCRPALACRDATQPNKRPVQVCQASCSRIFRGKCNSTPIPADSLLRENSHTLACGQPRHSRHTVNAACASHRSHANQTPASTSNAWCAQLEGNPAPVSASDFIDAIHQCPSLHLPRVLCARCS